MDIVVAIPSYNCANQIGRVIAGFDESLLARVREVVIIDNCSRDGTTEAAVAAVKRIGNPKIQVVRNLENFGLGGSHKAAFSHARRIGADYVAILHGDNQATTGELNSLIDAAEQEPGLTAVLGSRFMRGARLSGYSTLRTIGNRCLNFLYTILAMRRTSDLGSGLNIFRLRDLNDLRYMHFSDQMTFNIDLLLDYYAKGSAVRFVPISWSETDQVSNAKTFKVGWIALKALVRWRFGLAHRYPPRPGGYSFAKVA
jgi:glycosyltransferase involved in cell wall biosynthesis